MQIEKRLLSTLKQHEKMKAIAISNAPVQLAHFLISMRIQFRWGGGIYIVEDIDDPARFISFLQEYHGLNSHDLDQMEVVEAEIVGSEIYY